MGASSRDSIAEWVIGRYSVHDPIASGGMAVVHIGRLHGQAGFSRTVAVKRLHPQFARDPAFVQMFLDEANLAARIQHPNVVAPLDVVMVDDELLVVMEYVSGDTLARLWRESVKESGSIEPSIAANVMLGALHGLHAAHEARGENGVPLNIVHRDVSPQNIMIGLDGVTRVLDFGVAKAAMRSHVTREGEVKGKIAYMAREQMLGKEIDRRTDIFAAGIIFWEALAGRQLFGGEEIGRIVHRLSEGDVSPPSAHNPAVPRELDAIVLRALSRDPAHRFQSAREFAIAIEDVIVPATQHDVAEWVRRLGGLNLVKRLERLAVIETQSSSRMKSSQLSLHTPASMQTPASLQTPPSSPKHAVRGAPAEMVRMNTAVVGSPALGLGSDESPEIQVALTSGDAFAEPLTSAGTGNSSAEAEPDRLHPPRTIQKKHVALASGGVGLIILFVAAVAWQTPNPPVPASEAAGVAREAPAPAAETPTHRPLAEQARVERAVTTPQRLVEAAPALVVTALPPQNRAQTAAAKNGAPSTPLTAAAKGSARPTTSKSCNPPYTLDAKGIRRIKPECI